MPQPYGTFENLRKHNAVLHKPVTLHSRIQLAAWSNKCDTITQYCDYYTLSLYITDGYESYHETAGGWENGGGPDCFCLMPKESKSSWDIRDDLSFARLYYVDAHLREVDEKAWDKSLCSFTLDERTFGSDPGTTTVYYQFLLGNDWQQPANHLTLSVASSLLLMHLIQCYNNMQWRLPVATGGLAPVTLRNALTYIEAHLAYSVTLSDLVSEAALGEFHFARMFRQPMNMALHQYVMQRRMALAQ